ncbi:unnamed protein product [Urochloa humidicola]
MPDPARPSLLTTEEVLVDRRVLFVDELQEMIQETGGVPLDRSIESVLKRLPACTNMMEQECQEQMAIEEEMTRYLAEVEEPAFKMLLERKACRPSAVRKEPVTFTCADADYYREVLDGIDLHLPQLAASPGVNSLTLRISWPPDHYLRRYPLAGYIASCHYNLVAFYLGTHRPGLPSPGCYLVFNSWANSLALIPPLPTGLVTATSHCSIGSGVALLRHNQFSDYLLAELYLHQDAQTHLASNRATLFIWCSPGSGPLADRWIQKEVVLPLPADKGTRPATYSFRANMVLQVSSTSLCWVDLQTGILVCNHLERLAAGSTDDDLHFHFIPLPEECAIKSDPLSWRQAEEYRSMCCMGSKNIKFVCIDDCSMDKCSQGHPIGDAILTTWALESPLTNDWRWEECRTVYVLQLSGLPFSKDDSKLQRLIPSCPVISWRGADLMHLTVTDFQYKNEQWEAAGFYELSLCGARILSVFEFPSGCGGVPHSQIVATDISYYANKMWEWDGLQQDRQRHSEHQASRLLMGEELADEVSPDSLRMHRELLRMSKMAGEKELQRPATLVLCKDGLSLHRATSSALVGASPGSSKELVGLQCALDSHQI